VSTGGPGDIDRVGDIDVSGAVGVPDGLDRIWTPHRLAYIRGEAKPAGDPNDPAVCPFCRAPTLPDDESLIVARGVLTYAVLNLYPYNAGHLLVVPYRHVPDITDLDVDEAAEFMAFTQRSMTTIRAVSSAQGFNVGMNLGSVAGAGIAAHLHQHVVPRWGGDTNFMPIVGHTRVLPQLLHETRALFAAAWPQV
jgi:ATP adenylyltransferase